MRQIKFRGIDKARNEWVYGSLVIGKGVDYIVDAPVQQGIPTQMIEIVHGTESQSTNLLDKNGKEIYESDLIKYFGSIVEIKFGKFDNGFSYEDHRAGTGFYFEEYNDFFPLYDTSEMQVIGNKLQNPELFKT